MLQKKKRNFIVSHLCVRLTFSHLYCFLMRKFIVMQNESDAETCSDAGTHEDEMVLQIVSDVHLDVGGSGIIERVAPTLVLLGDVGAIDSSEFKRFMSDVCVRFERVIFVPGNHEYYSKFPKSVLDGTLKRLSDKHENFTVLNRAVCDDVATGYRLLGCTLWTHIDEESRDLVTAYINDYRLIHAAYRVAATVDDTNQWHERDVAWLKDELKRAKEDGVRAIVLTHHAPLLKGTSHPEYDNRSGPMKGLNQAFRVDLSHLMREYAPYAWIFGHTHWRCAFDYEGVRIQSNPVGYAREDIGKVSEKEAGILLLD